jgi:hypothetical protein
MTSTCESTKRTLVATQIDGYQQPTMNVYSGVRQQLGCSQIGNSLSKNRY